MATMQPPAGRKDFYIAIVCALPREADAITLLFDHFWDKHGDSYGRAEEDTNSYITGRIGEHNIVLALLPKVGNNTSAIATARLRSSYTGLKLVILVGICGGVPRIDGFDTRLGDVVVSKTVIQYDLGRQFPRHFLIKGAVEDSLGRANRDIRTLLAVFETELMRERLQVQTSRHLKCLQEAAKKKRRRANYQYPGAKEDRLFPPTYTHRHREQCSNCSGEPGIFCKAASEASCAELKCDANYLVVREHSAELDQSDGGAFTPEIFIGRIGSGSTVMKSGEDRDRIAAVHNLIAFDMEAAGVWDQAQCIVIRGISNYADSHKNDAWQDFAAATAASVTKAILGRYTPHDGDRDSALTNGIAGSSF
ncbi:hypothetical protein HG530_009339 [Fusarium avenaceum]|nr:hypothetical protein HG530_009339 [Fusarium avenaceum]